MLSKIAPFREFTSILNPHSRRIIFGISLNAIGGGMTLSLLMVYLHDIRGFTTTFGGLLIAWGGFRAKIFGFNFMLLNLGLGIGGLLSSLIIKEGSVISFQLMYWVDSLTYLMYLLIVLGLKTPHAGKYIAKEHEPKSGSYREIFSRKDLTVLTFAG